MKTKISEKINHFLNFFKNIPENARQYSEKIILTEGVQLEKNKNFADWCLNPNRQQLESLLYDLVNMTNISKEKYETLLCHPKYIGLTFVYFDETGRIPTRRGLAHFISSGFPYSNKE